MQEWIMNLLSLCMQAHEKGHHVEFSCGYYTVGILHMTEDKETGDFATVKYIEVRRTRPNNIDEAENYLKGLIL